MLSILAAVPILRYLIFFQMEVCPDGEDRFVGARVVLSGPALVLIGLILIFRVKSVIHRILGLVMTLCGVAWVFVIMLEIRAETG